MPRKFYIEDNQSIPAIKFSLTQPEGFTEITDLDEIRRLYVLEYNKRMLDGGDYVIRFTADRYIDVLNGIYTEQQAFDLESHTKDLFNELNNGLWLTAKNTNTNLSISGIYTQLMKDQIQLDIDNYISENY